jgi:hypothetical protein
MKTLFLLLAYLVLAPIAVSGQTITNPRTVEFVVTAASHTMTTTYELRHFLVGATSPVQVQNLDKPTPDAAGKIIAPITALPISLTNVYIARVAAVGTAGEAVSAASAETYSFVAVLVAPTSVSVKK